MAKTKENSNALSFSVDDRHYRETAIEALEYFLRFPLDHVGVTGIMREFAKLPGAKWFGKGNTDGKQFVFVKGNRGDAATLVAHADTYPLYGAHESPRYPRDGVHSFVTEDGKIKSADDYDHQCPKKVAGLGADDRAGCAILWLLKDCGHHLLITDGEEKGQKGARYLMEDLVGDPEATHIIDAIHNSSFVLSFDRGNPNNDHKEYKCYDIKVSEEFKRYIETETNGYKDPGAGRNADVTVLCASGCCGANLGVGYVNEHRENEYIVIDHWLNTLCIAAKMLEKPLNRFPLKMC